MQDANGHSFGRANPAPQQPLAFPFAEAALLPLVEAPPPPPSRLWKPPTTPACGRGWGRAPRRAGRLPNRTAAGPHPASPASGGGEGSPRPPRRPFPACRGGRAPIPFTEAASPPSRLWRLPHRSPPACGRGWGRVPRCGGRLPSRTAVGPLPASPASGGGEEARRPLRRPFPACRGGRAPIPFTEAASPPSRLWKPPTTPACGKGWGRAPRRAGHLPSRTAVGPLTASPASGGGEDSRRPLRCPFPACGGCPAVSLSRLWKPPATPLPLAGGAGGGSLNAAGICQAARPPAPTRPPPQAGEGKDRGYRSVVPSPLVEAAEPPSRLPKRPRLPLPLVEAAPSLPSRLQEGLGEGPSTRRAFAKPHGRWPPPGLPRKRGRRAIEAAAPLSLPRLWRRPSPHPVYQSGLASLSRLWRLPHRSPPACGRGWGRGPRRSGRLPGGSRAGFPSRAVGIGGGASCANRLSPMRHTHTNHDTP